jgi:hypothetical protein
MKDINWIYNVGTSHRLPQLDRILTCSMALQVIHRPTFLQEVSELWTCIAEGNTSRIDPAWLSLYFMVRGKSLIQIGICYDFLSAGVMLGCKQA